MTDRRNLSPADELGLLRDEIRRLKAREAELREALISEPAARRGADFRVEVKEQTRRTFDRTLLPPEITDDPRFWKTSVSQVVKVVSLAEAAEAPSGSLIDDEDV
ncbi:MAG: hypothetical protein AAF568_09085 [Pseudomonadota bacterium]